MGFKAVLMDFLAVATIIVMLSFAFGFSIAAAYLEFLVEKHILENFYSSDLLLLP